MQFGLMIIGDEILNGTRTDAHFPAVKNLLAARGLQLAWVEYVADEPHDIIQRLTRSSQGHVPVFVTGGIGATPDDHTRQAAAAARGLALLQHPEAAQLIEAISIKNNDDLNGALHQQRLQMAYFPEGSGIIPNPFNNVAGFYLPESEGQKAHYFVPGFPVMAHPMIEWVLDTFYADAFFKNRVMHLSATVYGLQESQITPLMVAIERDFAGIKTYSLPKISETPNEQTTARRYQIELGVKACGSASDALQTAWNRLQSEVLALGAELDGI